MFGEWHFSLNVNREKWGRGGWCIKARSSEADAKG